MPPKTEPVRSEAFARDFARLYLRFLQHHSTVDSVTIDSFAEVFHASKVEYLHYSGGTTLDRPFFPTITEDLLQLSSAYLSLPPAVTPRAVRIFGLLLSLFLYSTQPSRRCTTETATAAQGTDAAPPASTAEECAVPPTPPQHRLASLPLRRIPISVGTMRHLLASMPEDVQARTPLHRGDAAAASEAHGEALDRPSALSTTASLVPLSHTEARVVLTLHRAGAWHVEPYIADSGSISALLAGHVACGAPLIVQDAAPLPPPLLAATLTARAMVNATAPPGAVGGADSLFRNAEFLQLCREYEQKRQQLLS